MCVYVHTREVNNMCVHGQQNVCTWSTECVHGQQNVYMVNNMCTWSTTYAHDGQMLRKHLVNYTTNYMQTVT